jgi:hypothetical protein
MREKKENISREPKNHKAHTCNGVGFGAVTTMENQAVFCHADSATVGLDPQRPCFVSGHGFSHAENSRQWIGL